MATYRTVEPDLDFIREVQVAGGSSLKKCFQCATCSVVCALAPDRAPYPRKEMVFAQWGLADRLAGDSHVWLCHQCNDCTTHCPRGAKPGEVLGGIRAALIRRLAFPRALGETVGDLPWMPVVLLFGAVLVLLFRQLFGATGIPAGEIEYGRFYPHEALYVLFGGGFGLMLLSMIVSGRRFWRAISQGTARPEGGLSAGAAVVAVIKEILLHSRFRECTESRSRSLSHLLVFYGFAGLFVVTSVVAPLAWLGLYPLSLWNPLKILGNAAGIAMCLGVILLIMDRADREQGEGHAYFDWFFLVMNLILGVSGMLLMILRLVIQPAEPSVTYLTAAYGTYFVHLVAVFVVILLLPFTKFAHLYYRFLAMVHAKMAGIPTGRAR